VYAHARVLGEFCSRNVGVKMGLVSEINNKLFCSFFLEDIFLRVEGDGFYAGG